METINTIIIEVMNTIYNFHLQCCTQTIIVQRLSWIVTMTLKHLLILYLAGVSLSFDRLGQLSQKWTFVGKFEEKLGSTLLDENYALNRELLFSKSGSPIWTFESAIKT